MPRRIIRLEYPATCKDCGAELKPGAEARYYGKGRVYGTKCHPDRREPKTERQPVPTIDTPPIDPGQLDDNDRGAFLFEYAVGRR